MADEWRRRRRHKVGGRRRRDYGVGREEKRGEKRIEENTGCGTIRQWRMGEKRRSEETRGEEEKVRDDARLGGSG